MKVVVTIVLVLAAAIILWDAAFRQFIRVTSPNPSEQAQQFAHKLNLAAAAVQAIVGIGVLVILLWVLSLRGV